MKSDKAIYWSTTGIIALLMFASACTFAFSSSAPGAFQHLGLPSTWFRVELTVAKFLGVLALVIPQVPYRMKEFAYFGFGLTLVSADIAHLSSGDPWWLVLFHGFFLTVLVTSFIYFHRMRGRDRWTGLPRP